jgi:F0F1-type ATP synthase membrane subunit b/b'
MATQDPGRAQPATSLTSLPRIDDLPTAAQGYERVKVEEAFDAFRRHVTSLQANLRVLQAAPRRGTAEPIGHAVRMDTLHLIRAAAEFADTIERDAQEAATTQVARAEQEIREAQMELQQQEAEIARIRQETERQRAEIMNAARTEARDILTKANKDSSQEMRQAESSGARLLEQSRHQATEMTNAARAEVEQTLEWARAQADVIVQRARGGAEQLLAAAGHGDPAIREAVDAIVRAAESTVATRRGPERPEAAGGVETPSSSPSPPEAVPTADPKPGKSEEGPTAQAEAADEEAPESGKADRPSGEERKPTEAS